MDPCQHLCGDDNSRRAEVEEKLNQMLNEGVIELVNEPCAWVPPNLH